VAPEHTCAVFGLAQVAPARACAVFSTTQVAPEHTCTVFLLFLMFLYAPVCF